MELLDSNFWRIVCVSIRVSGTAVIIASVVGIPMGVWLGLSRGRVTIPLRVLVQTGMALPPVVIGLLLYILLCAAARWRSSAGCIRPKRWSWPS